jgi:hypothetical protein
MNAIRNSANHPVPILQAAPQAKGSLSLQALPTPAAGIAVQFPRFARTLHRFGNHLAEIPQPSFEARSSTV